MTVSSSPYEGFEAFYQKQHPSVLAVLVLAIGDLDLAEDAAAEAFTRALDRWERVDAMRSPAGWVYRVALNVARRKQRRRALERRLLRMADPVRPLPAPAGEAWALVRELPPRQRQVVVLRYVADLAEHEIASILGVKRSSVSSALTAAHRRLRSDISEPSDSLGVPHA